MNNNNTKTVTFTAILLISLGGLFLLRNFGLLNFRLPSNLISWRLIPLFIGINALGKGKQVEGIIGIAIAVIFFIPDFLTQAQTDFYRKLWPLLFVAGGAYIFYKNFYKGKYDIKTLNTPLDSNFDTIDETHIMSGGTSKLNSKQFAGGSIRCFMGGAQIDLTETDLAPNAVLNVFTVMGGVQIKIPKEWNVKSDVFPIMGGVEDQISKFPASVVNDEKKFTITGNVVMGGIEIKRI